jgi:SPP1 gp7 family putative phage head morphogenesis protein
MPIIVAEAQAEVEQIAVRRGTDLARFAAGLSRRAAAELARAFRGVLTDQIVSALARVAARGPEVGPHSRIGLRERLSAFDRRLAAVLDRVSLTTREELRALATEEGQHEALVLGAVLDTALVVPGVRDLQRVVGSATWMGGRLSDHLRDWTINVRRGVRREIMTGLASGASADAIAQRITGTRTIRGLFDRALESFTTRVASAAHAVANLARGLVYEQNPEVIRRVMWIATLDGRTCPRCAVLHGRVFVAREARRPPLHPNCRCILAPVVAAGTPGASVPVDFDAWLGEQPAAVQNEMLGRSRAEMFRGGERLSRFVAGNRTLTLEELRSRRVGS